MTYQITWPVPNHVIMVTLVGGIMANEVEAIANEMQIAIQALAEGSMVHLLIDARQATIQDKIWNYGKLRLKRDQRVHLVIVIGDSRLSGLIIAIFSKIINISIHYRETIGEALQVIGAHDLSVSEYLKE